ncbi:class I tRNA ligase family protein [Candidatus Dojkabacteria bacterium]|nr:class I tRNA ligase family protein [Candidatus Dojkabacteria bacterium]
MSKKDFYEQLPRETLSEREDKITKFWKQSKIFEKSVEQRPQDKHYSFLDGPPFVTGIPHWGSLLPRIAKDVIPRYKTMKGYRVRRVWGWDCHGLPIEEKTEKKVGLKNRRDIEKFGIGKFLDACRSYVEEVSSEWGWYVDKIGEWIDFENAYRTMDEDYMESVIWVFKQIYDKGLIYEGVKTLLFCPRCGTPVSKFEIAMDDSYAETEDPAVTVEFPLKYSKTGLGVGVVIENSDGEILMAIRNEKGREKSVGIIGGKAEKGEDMLETVKRECEEEIGIVPEKIELVGSSVDVFEGRLFHTHHFKAFLDEDAEKLQACEEVKDLQWVKKEDIPWEKLHIPTRRCIEDVLNEKPYPEIGEKHPRVAALAWTTTPWTLPANRALVVDESKTYVMIKSKSPDNYYILAKERLEEVLGDDPYEIVDEFLGKELVGLSYEAPYEYYEPNENDWKIYSYKGMVTMDEGTGIVHSAPGFGEIDTEMGLHYELTMMFTVDDEGKFVDKVKDYAGQYVKDADKNIIFDLGEEGKDVLFKVERINHRYPFCYRCETPLLQKSLKSWFINVSKLKDQLLKGNESINWIPEKMVSRFVNNIKDAPDWCISRTRYWATAMPVWRCDKCDEIEVFGSKAEIEERSGQKVESLHRTGVDPIKFECKACKGAEKGEMIRIPEVLDVWVESAAMPYAQIHYPFENEDLFEETFPADYIIEYEGQIRAWFYCMHVISHALKGKNSFKNVVTTGTMAGNDGRKMSKSFGNYSDPRGTIEEYGGDAVRLYLMGSPVMLGDGPNFDEKEIDNQVKTILFPIYNSLKYLQTYAKVHNWEPESLDEPDSADLENILDKWIIARLRQFKSDFEGALEKYEMPPAVREVAPFVSDLSTWYIRRSRDRFVAGDKVALSVLYYVLVELAKIVAPVAPFVAEAVYEKLVLANFEKEPESVHLCLYPEYPELSQSDAELMTQMALLREVASAGLSVRENNSLKLRQPLSEVVVASPDVEFESWMLEILSEELNVKDARALKVSKFNDLDENYQVEAGQSQLRDINGKVKKYTYKLGIDTKLTAELKEEGLLNDFSRQVQNARKKAGCKVGEIVKFEYDATNEVLSSVVEANRKELEEKLKIELVEGSDLAVVS